MNYMSLRIFMLYFTAALSLLGCGDDDVTNDLNEPLPVMLAVSNLSRLQPGEGHYELWITFPVEEGSLTKTANGDESLVSVGKFNIDASGNLIELDGTSATFFLDPAKDERIAINAIISLESEGDDDNEHGSRLMGSEDQFINGVITIVTSTALGNNALNVDLSTASGVYIIATPSDSDSANESYGIWWTDRAATNPGLSLPLLPEYEEEHEGEEEPGWLYEGWVIDTTTGENFSTGKFKFAIGFDADSAGQYSDTLPGYPFPGSDFVQGKMILVNNGNHRAAISIEPEPDNRLETPFLPFLLIDEIPSGYHGEGVERMMRNLAAELPTAVVSFERTNGN